MRTAYEELQIRPGADIAVARAAWRALQKTAHPDAEPGATPARRRELAARSVALNLALDELEDPVSRAALDRRIAAERLALAARDRRAAEEAADRARREATTVKCDQALDYFLRATATRQAPEPVPVATIVHYWPNAPMPDPGPSSATLAVLRGSCAVLARLAGAGRPGFLGFALLGAVAVGSWAAIGAAAFQAPLLVLVAAFCLDLGRVARRLAG